MKISEWSHRILFLLTIVVLSCDSKNEEVFNGIFSKNGSLATILTTPATSITEISAEAGGNITDNGSSYIIARGICWGTDQDPDTSDFKIVTGKEPGEFVCNISGLSKGTLYYIRAYVSNTIGTAYGNQESFTTLNIPTISTASISDITDSTAVSGGNITADGGVDVTARGVCWSTNQNPTITDTLSNDGSGKGIFTSTLKRLVPNTTYYVRAYATNIVGTAYGNEIVFTAINNINGAVFDIDGNTYNTVTIGSQTWFQENLKTTRYTDGSAIPNITDNSTWGNLASGAYSWYNNDQATYRSSYGALYNFYTTIDSRNLCPTGWHVPTDAEWKALTSYLGGESIAGAKLKEAGTDHWSNPNSGATNESGFTALPGGNRYMGGYYGLIGIHGSWWSSTESSGTLARLRGISYNNSTVYNDTSGSKLDGYSIRCLEDEVQVGPVTPSITTVPASSITQTMATSGGNITSNGGAAITTRGVCWSSLPTPTIALTTKTSDGAGSGSFTSSITGLSPATLYYVRAYATNSVGTAYGNELTFTTSVATTLIPSITTTAISSITQTTAISGGNVSSDGDATVTARGVCWGPSASPTITNSKTSDGSGTGTFSSSVTGLTSGTLYYVRAYAMNSIGTAYGNEISFTTLPASGGTVTDIDGNVYNTVVIGTQTWMGENLKTTKYRDGTLIPSIQYSTTSSYYWYNNDENNKNIFGGLYNYYAAIDSRKICPTGWHVPAIDEWMILSTYLGGVNTAGGQLKEVGTSHWVSPNSGATNSTGFNALPGGLGDGSYFYGLGNLGYWWTTTQYVGDWGSLFELSNANTLLTYRYEPMKYGLSVRCLKGEIQFPLLSTNSISSISQTNATSGGEIISDGGANIIARGVCWGTSSSPTIAGNKTNEGTGVGTFTSNLTGLSSNTTYFIRAYATNSIGTSYGQEISFTSNDISGLAIGQSYLGGVIAYILRTGDPGYKAGETHGLIAAPSDLSTGAEWGCSGTVITGADGTAIGSGYQNTIDIVNGCTTPGIAARLCYDFILNGFSDWYLPSKDELFILYLNRVAIGGFSSNHYCSSSENGIGYEDLFFTIGFQGYNNKSGNSYVRAIRSF